MNGHRWLARVSLVFVALAAGMGWAASFVGLHDYGVHQLNGFSDLTAWFIPGAVDGAAFATSLMAYRANIRGRAAVRARLLMWGFTAASGWINWMHQSAPQPRLVAAGLPVAAVAVFDVVLFELRADHAERHGRRAFRFRPGLLVLRWLVDPAGTRSAIAGQVLAIDVAEVIGTGSAPAQADALTVWRSMPSADLARPDTEHAITHTPNDGQHTVSTHARDAARVREQARALVRHYPDRWTGARLGKRFNRTDRWGRMQLDAVRRELENTDLAPTG